METTTHHITISKCTTHAKRMRIQSTTGETFLEASGVFCDLPEVGDSVYVTTCQKGMMVDLQPAPHSPEMALWLKMA